MKPAPDLLTPNRSLEPHRSPRTPLPQVDYSYRSAVATSAPASAKMENQRAEIKTFRTMSRQFFGVEAARESLKEGILFGWIMLVAAWPLSVVLNQLGTMMISPPPW